MKGGAVLWFTGLSGAGKTTIARELRSFCSGKSVLPVLLDGDEIRAISGPTGFGEADRKAHNLRVGKLAALLEAQGHLVIAALISPYEKARQEVRSLCRNFIEIYVDTPLETCVERDPKGLYERALRNEIREFTGISAPYEAPVDPDIRINTLEVSPQVAAEWIWKYCQKMWDGK